MSKFYGIEAAPGKETKPVFSAPSEIFHLSVIAIPAGAQGHATLYATIDGTTLAVATVDSARNIFQVAVDMIMPASQKPVITVKGNTKLHLTGYIDDMNDSGMPGDDEDEDSDNFSEDGDSEEASESEDEELPVEKATKALEAKAAEAKKPAAPAAPAKKEESDDDLDDEDLDDLDDEEMDEEDLDLDGMDEEDFDEEDLDFDGEEMESEEDESESESEDEAPPASKARLEGNKFAGKPASNGKPAQGQNRDAGKKYGRV